MPRYVPAQAARMLRDPLRIRFACDYRRNAAFARSDARTRDWQGRTLAGLLHPAEMENAIAWLNETVDNLLAGRQVEIDPVRLGAAPKKTGGHRDIWIMSYRRRCLSNLVTQVLAATTTPLLPDHVRAYVPGKQNPVGETILDVAERVRGGMIVKYFREDFRSFFDVIPTGLVQRALSHFGFAEEVQALVLAPLRAPRWIGIPGGPGRYVTHETGIPAGLPESSVLANLVCHGLDADLQALRERLFVARYSDDVFGGGEQTAVLRGARVLQRWARSEGIGIKRMAHNASAGSRVHDVRNRRIELLGAEIDRNGEVHIPKTTIDAKLKEIDDAVAAANEHYGSTGGRFFGRSQYAGGVPVSVMDYDDIRERAYSFLEYWSGLNRAEAERFEDVVDRRHKGLLRSTREPAAVWEASLGSQQVREPKDELTNTSPSGLPMTAVHSTSLPMAHGADGRDMAADSVVVGRRASDHGNIAREEGNLQQRVDSRTGTSPFASPQGLSGRAGQRAELGAHAHRDGLVDEGDAAGRLSLSVSPPHPGRDYISQVVEPLHAREGMSLEHGMGASLETPDPSRHLDVDLYIEVRTRWVRPQAGAPGTRIEFVYPECNQSFAEHRPGIRPEVALVRAIRILVEQAAARGEHALAVRCSPWLPKHLISRSRRFRSPAFFADVLELHQRAADLQVALRIVGDPALQELRPQHASS